MNNDFKQKYGPWALVTGAAEGLGAAFAETLAKLELNLVLVDRQGEKLSITANKLRREHGIDVVEVLADFTETDFLKKIEDASGNLEIGLLVSNAALGQVGPFVENDLDELLSNLNVNIRAPLILTHTYSKKMVTRGRGGIILIASNSAYQGAPYVANYAATKAYNLILGEALWYELAKQGVDAIAFVPGATNTPSLRSTRPALVEGQPTPGVLLPEDVAAAAVAALGKTPSARPDWKSKLETFFLTRILSRRRVVRLVGENMDKNYERT